MSSATRLEISRDLLRQIHAHGEQVYPEEGAGFLLGSTDGEQRQVVGVLAIHNSREEGARHNRYLITAQDVMAGEDEADHRGLEIVGIFHSHPDHPNRPSEFDREWALPWLSYIITSVQSGAAVESRSWRLSDDRQQFDEETIVVVV